MCSMASYSITSEVIGIDSFTVIVRSCGTSFQGPLEESGAVLLEQVYQVLIQAVYLSFVKNNHEVADRIVQPLLIPMVTTDQPFLIHHLEYFSYFIDGFARPVSDHPGSSSSWVRCNAISAFSGVKRCSRSVLQHPLARRVACRKRIQVPG